ncbi:MAG: baseplate J/gp47 family protein [Candidatus Dormibacteraceae bacterium]
MATDPIYLEPEAEVPELIDRLRRSAGDDVPVVVPVRSTIGRSRFDLALINHYGGRLGKRIAIISPEETTRQMAREVGLAGYAALGQFDAGLAESVPGSAATLSESLSPAPSPLAWPVPPSPLAPSPVAASLDPGGVTEMPSPGQEAPTAMRRGSTYRGSSPRPAGGARPRRLLYGGAAAVMLAGLLAVALYVPSAQVTLIAQAQPLSKPFDVTGAAGHGPIPTRAITASDTATQTIPTTGVQTTPAKAAAGAVTIADSCAGPGFYIPQGALVSGGGQEFQITTADAQAGNGTPVPAGKQVPFSVRAVTAGAAGDVPAGTITSVDNSPMDPLTGQPCLKASQADPTGGGADAVSRHVMSQDDYNNARLALQKQLQKQLTSDLAKQARRGEKVAAQNVTFEPAQFTADHKVGDKVDSFTAAMTLKGDASAYKDAEVRKALLDALRGKVRSGYQLTDNGLKTDYQVTAASGDGLMTFHGTASGYVAPVLDFATIKSHLAGHSRSTAAAYLRGLPVRSANYTESPFELPMLPWLSSRIEVRYVVEQGKAATQPA